MAFQVSSGPGALAPSTTKTFVDLATPSGGVARVYKWWVGSDATSAGTATSALRVQVGLFSAAVTTHTAATPNKVDGTDGNLASQTTAGILTTSEGAGTATSIEEHVLQLTQGELIIWEPIPFLVPAASFWRIRLISPAGIGTTNIYAGFAYDE